MDHDRETPRAVGGFSTPFMGRILRDPDPGPFAGAGGGGSPAPTENPASGQTAAEPPAQTQQPLGGERPSFNPNSDPAPSGAASPGGSVVDANQPAGAGITQQQAAWTSIRDAARTFGYDPGDQFQDDASFLGHLITSAQRAQQADVYARLGQQLAPHAADIQGYLAQRQQQQAQPQRNPWEPPPFDERWAALVERDQATGVYIARPGVPPEIARQVNEYADWQARFQRNPTEFITQAAQAQAREIAAQTFREQYAQVQREQTVQSILAENRSWLYQTDAAGQVVRQHGGQPALSAAGTRYAAHIRSLQQAGVTDPRMQDTIAKQILRGELAAAQAQQGQQQGNQAASPQTQQAVHRPNQNPLGTLPPTERQTTPGAQGTEPSYAGTDLRSALARAFAAEGITDNDFAPPGV